MDKMVMVLRFLLFRLSWGLALGPEKVVNFLIAFNCRMLDYFIHSWCTNIVLKLKPIIVICSVFFEGFCIANSFGPIITNYI